MGIFNIYCMKAPKMVSFALYTPARNSFPIKRTQELKNLVIPPRPQLTPCVLPPESSNRDFVGCCDEPANRHFPLLGHFQLLLKKIPDLLHQKWGTFSCLLPSPWRSPALVSGRATCLSLVSVDTPSTPAASPLRPRSSSRCSAL